MKRRNETRRRRPRSLAAEIDELSERLAVDESGIEDWGDELANEEAKIVDEGTGLHLTENEHQNELAMENWPTDADNMSTVAKQKIAKRLIKMAKILLEDD